MILAGGSIAARREDGSIRIEPFDVSQVNPNSYNYRLHPVLRERISSVIDPHDENSQQWLYHVIPESGFVLRPRTVYLGTTAEEIGGDRYVPSLIGRSSMGRLGMFLQISADLGNLGASHRWTLEIVAVQPVRVYPNMKVGQVSFWRPVGEIDAQYEGYLGRQSSPTTTPAGYIK